VLDLLQDDAQLSVGSGQPDILAVDLVGGDVVAERAGPERRRRGQIVGPAVDDQGAQAALVHGFVLLFADGGTAGGQSYRLAPAGKSARCGLTTQKRWPVGACSTM